MMNPNVLWAQRSDAVWLTVEVFDADDIKFELKEDSLSFSCTSGGKPYGFNLDLFKPVKVEESKYLKHRLVDICLRKAEEEDWPRLTKENKKLPWIKVDWSKWEDSDAEEEAAPFDMSNMGGFGDFGMPGGFSDFAGEDSDDEEDELPELTEEGTEKSPSSGKGLIEEVNQAS